MSFQKTGHAPAIGEAFKVSKAGAKSEEPVVKPSPCAKCASSCDTRGVCSSCGHVNSRL